jgi:hypothetical protein
LNCSMISAALMQDVSLRMAMTASTGAVPPKRRNSLPSN